MNHTAQINLNVDDWTTLLVGIYPSPGPVYDAEIVSGPRSQRQVVDPTSDVGGGTTTTYTRGHLLRLRQVVHEAQLFVDRRTRQVIDACRLQRADRRRGRRGGGSTTYTIWSELTPAARTGSSRPAVEVERARNNDITIDTLNSRSTVYKAALLQELVADYSIDFLAVSESWMKPDAPDALDAAPDGYHILHSSRADDRRACGLALV